MVDRVNLFIVSYLMFLISLRRGVVGDFCLDFMDNLLSDLGKVILL